MKAIQTISLVAVLLLVFSIPVLAHHSFSSMFDIKREVTITGVISKLQLTNPHGYVHIDTTDPDTGEMTTWLFETTGPGSLRRMGLTRDVVGKNVVAEGYGAKDGSNFAWGMKYVFEDGRTILTSRPRQ